MNELRTLTVLKNNKTTKSLKIKIGSSSYSVIYHKNRACYGESSNIELSYSSKKYYTNRVWLYDGWESEHSPEIPRDLIYDMVNFIKTHNEPFSEESLDTFDRTGKYNSVLYDLYTHCVRLCSVSKYLYIVRGGTISDSSFCVDLKTNIIYQCGNSDINVLDGTEIPYFGYDSTDISPDEFERREIENFNTSLLDHYDIYVELREFIEKVKNDPTQTYQWPFKTFLPYGDIK